MRTLLLMRHAKSSWAEDALPDEERPLNERGKDAAVQMGKFLCDKGLAPGLILVSPAKRARQTANRVKDAGGFEAPIVQVPRLYFAGPEAYLDCIETVPNAVQIVLVIGHNPGIESLSQRIGDRPVRMPTASVAWIRIDGDDWRGVRSPSGVSLAEVYRPKELKPRE